MALAQPRIPSRVPDPRDANTQIPWHEAREGGDLNLICMTGYIGNSPVLEQTYARQSDFVLLRLACHKYIQFETHQPIEQVNWVSWVGYGRMARMICEKYYKGCRVYIQGEFRTDEYVRARGGSDRRAPRKVRRETHIILKIRMLTRPNAPPRPDHPPPVGLPADYGVARASNQHYRKWVPNPEDGFATFDPDGPMPADAKELDPDKLPEPPY